MAGVGKVGDIDEPDEDADDGNDLGELITKVVELLLQGSWFRDLGRDAFVDVANGSVGASEDDHSLGVASDNGGAREEHVDLILQDCLLVANYCLAVLAHALALSGKNGLVDGEAVALDCNQSAVGWDARANGNIDDVTGHQLLSLDSRDVSIAKDVGLVGRVFL